MIPACAILRTEAYDGDMDGQQARDRRVKANLSMDPAVKTRLQHFAAHTNRTLSAAVEVLCTEALDAREKENPTYGHD